MHKVFEIAKLIDLKKVRYQHAETGVCYIYGDVYYTEDAIKTIVTGGRIGVHFFGSNFEIFAIKISTNIEIEHFLQHKHKVKELYLNNEINRCIGWEIYRSLHEIPFDEHVITDDYTRILDGTDDIDFPEDYENFKTRMEAIHTNENN